MFKRLFVLVLLVIATVSINTPAQAADGLYCEAHLSAARWSYFCDAPAGYTSYSWSVQRIGGTQLYVTSSNRLVNLCTKGAFYTASAIAIDSSGNLVDVDPVTFQCLA